MTAQSKNQEKGKALHDLFMEIFELHAALSKIMDEVHAKAGLSTSQLKILRALRRIGPATVPDIAALLGVSRQFIQNVCNELETKGFIIFSDNPRHKRSRLAALTEPGRTIFQETRHKENMIIEQAFPEITPKEAKDAYELLKRIRFSVTMPFG